MTSTVFFHQKIFGFKQIFRKIISQAIENFRIENFEWDSAPYVMIIGTQCGNLRIFLSFKNYVKATLVVYSKKLQFCEF